jgi:hypothetical protein
LDLKTEKKCLYFSRREGYTGFEIIGGYYYCCSCRKEVAPENVNEDWEHDLCGCVVNWVDNEIFVEEETV